MNILIEDWIDVPSVYCFNMTYTVLRNILGRAQIECLHKNLTRANTKAGIPHCE